MTRKTVFWSRTVAIAALAASSLGIVGCLKAPDYSVVPEISFNSITLTSIAGPRGANRKDSVSVVVNFQDGDGDLGLEGDRFGIASDSMNPFKRLKPDRITPNRYYRNYFVDVFLKNRTTGIYEKLSANRLPNGDYNGRYPRLVSADTKPAPLKGTITRALLFNYGTPFFGGDEVRFDITIADRAFHESNTITTGSIVIPPR